MKKVAERLKTGASEAFVKRVSASLPDSAQHEGDGDSLKCLAVFVFMESSLKCSACEKQVRLEHVPKHIKLLDCVFLYPSTESKSSFSLTKSHTLRLMMCLDGSAYVCVDTNVYTDKGLNWLLQCFYKVL